MNHTKLSLKRWKKELRRRKIKAHIRRVGRVLYESEKINVICVGCQEIRNIRFMTSVGGGLGPCKACVAKKGAGNESTSKKS